MATVSSHRRAICLTVRPFGARPTASSTRSARDTLRIRSEGSARGSRTTTSAAGDLHHMKYMARAKCLFGSRMPDHHPRRVRRQTRSVASGRGRRRFADHDRHRRSPPPRHRREPARSGSAPARSPPRSPASCPVFLVGGLAVQMGEDLRLLPRRAGPGRRGLLRGERLASVPVRAAWSSGTGRPWSAAPASLLAAGCHAGRGGAGPVVPGAGRAAALGGAAQRPRPARQQRRAGPARAGPPAGAVVRREAGRHPGLHAAGRGGGARRSH